jgi:hypothetical protein
MRRSCVVIAVWVCLSSSPALAEDGLDLSGSFRARYEAIDNQARVGFDNADALLNLRTILTAEYRGDGFRAGAELYDSRVYLADAGTPVTTSEVNAFELVQAWIAADLASPLGAGTSATVQAGRFTLNLGSRRLVAADDYRNTTSGYTGLRTDINFDAGTRATLIYVLPQVRLPDDNAALRNNRVAWDRESFDLVLWGGLASKARAIGETTAEVSFYHLGERDAPGQPTRNRSLETLGLRFIRDPKAERWDHEIEVIRQWGTVRASLANNAPVRDVSAWFVHADVGYTFASGWKPRVSAEFDYASGDRGGGSFNRFDTLFGMRRADLAPSGIYSAIGRTNIMTPSVRIEAAPSRRLDLFVKFRLMWLASRTDSFSTTGVRDAAGNSGRFAGQQLEGRARWWVAPEKLRFEATGALLRKGRFLKTAPNATGGGDTRYISLNLTAFF